MKCLIALRVFCFTSLILARVASGIADSREVDMTDLFKF